jgi:SAM-dependent methyltransferase
MGATDPHDTHGLGYGSVDGDPNAAVLLDAMDATATWEATRQLRAWERERLALAPGQRLLDVGCGLGDAALAFAADLGAAGEIVGVDASAEMVHGARARAASVRCLTRFVVGDAMALDEPDRSFDAVRSERTLQWLADPAAAVAEMARVVRPGGRVSLIDTDWSSFAIDVGDHELAASVRDTMQVERSRPSHVGRRLGELAGSAGLAVVAATSATQTWTEWDPDRSPAPTGCFSMRSLADDVVDAGRLGRDEIDRFVSTIEEAARRGRFRMHLTMHAVVALGRVEERGAAPTPPT